MTREEAKALYSKAIDAGYSDEEAKAAISKRLGASPAESAQQEEPPQPAENTQPQSMGDEAFKYYNDEMQRAQSENRPVAAGFGRSLLGTMQGARKLYNQATGDEDTVNRINQQNQGVNDYWEQNDPTGSGFSKADAGKALGDISQFIGMPGKGIQGGIAGGAAQGALQPTTADQSQTNNAALGGIIGGAIPAAAKLPNAIRKLWTKTDANSALEDFVSKRLGAQRGGNSAGAYSGIRDTVEAKHDQLADALSKRYTSVESAGDKLPPVELQESSRLPESALTLPEEVANALSPGAKRVAEALQRGATKTSPIVDAAGKNIQDPAKVGFSEVRDTIRELRQAKRAMPYTDAGIMRGKQIDNITGRLSEDLDNWGGLGPTKTNAVLQDAKATDSAYRDQVAPFNDKTQIVGQLRRGTGDEGAINRLFLGPDKGQAVSELTSRVPETREGLRNLYGKNLLQERGGTTQIRQLDGGTTAEALLTPQERAYTTHLAAAVRDNKGGEGIDLPHLMGSLLRRVPGGGKKLTDMVTGVNRYGQKGVYVPPKLLQSLLRVYSVPQTSGEE